MVAKIRLLALVLVCVVVFTAAAALSGPQVLVGSDLAEFVGADPDCDTSGLQNNACGNNPNNGPGITCPNTIVVKRCKPSAPGDGSLCKPNSSALQHCTDARCVPVNADTTGGKCK